LIATRGAGLQATYGAVLVAYANDSDVALLRLTAPPPASFHARLNGWNAAFEPPRRCATIHHPGGDLQKVGIFFSETKKQSPNTGARAHNTLHKSLGYSIGEPARQSACEARP